MRLQDYGLNMQATVQQLVQVIILSIQGLCFTMVEA